MRRLYRSSKERVLCGVCGGLAEYLRVDPVLIRLAAIAVFIANPAVTIILYIAACILMPEGPEEVGKEESRVAKVTEEVIPNIRGASMLALIVIGAILIVAGVSIVLQPLAGWDVVSLLRQAWEYLTSSAKLIAGAVLVVVGAVLVAAAGKRIPRK